MDERLSQIAAESDFDRERRRRAISLIAARLRSEPDDVSPMLPFEEVVAALGRTGESDLGVQEIRLDSIVGTVDRTAGTFDRAFRPATKGVRGRWESIAAARRRGVDLPPIDVYRIGDLHFVQDGHHRVSVARSRGDVTIQAHVRQVTTKLGAGRELMLRDLPLKRHERMFHERVPLPKGARSRIVLSDEWRYAQLSMIVEAWGYRASHDRGHLLSREELALEWFIGEYEPVIAARSPRRISAVRAPRRSATCASRCCASCCSTRTSGPPRSWSGCRGRCGRRRATTRWCTSS